MSINDTSLNTGRGRCLSMQLWNCALSTKICSLKMSIPTIFVGSGFCDTTTQVTRMTEALTSVSGHTTMFKKFRHTGGK